MVLMRGKSADSDDETDIMGDPAPVVMRCSNGAASGR
jgi:hypothetical protein